MYFFYLFLYYENHTQYIVRKVKKERQSRYLSSIFLWAELPEIKIVID